MIHWLSVLTRTQRLWIFVAVDAVLLPAALLTAIVLRVGGWPKDLELYWLILPMAPLVAIPVLVQRGLYRAVIRYIDEKAMLTVVSSVSFSVLLLAAVIVLFRFTAMPRTALVMYWVLAMGYIGASRYIVRGLLRRLERPTHRRIPVAIYGAGHAGRQLALALQQDCDYHVRFFFDDDETLQHREVQGLTVYPASRAAEVLRAKAIRQVWLAIPSISQSRRRFLLHRFDDLSVQLKTVPDVKDLVNGTITAAEIPEVTIEELLGREIVEPIPALMGAHLFGKVVMVTGAGGSIGSELCRQIIAQKPLCLLLLEHSEFALYQVELEMRKAAGSSQIMPLLGSVTDQVRIEKLCLQHKVQTIYHAAAYKHVSLLEENPFEAVHNNIFGTWSTAEAAFNAAVETFVLISTDKAVRPVSVMGATKRVAERITQAFAARSVSHTLFTIVRFGNVLGSSGSVIPLFRSQLEQGGPITLTHRDVTRYFMTIPEAAQLVIQAGALATGGEVFLLEMGEPIKIYDLARKMVNLSGLSLQDPAQNLDGDIRLEVTGLRSGEKLHEELFIDDLAVETLHPRIRRATEAGHSPVAWEGVLMQLRSACEGADREQLRTILSSIIHECDWAG